MNRPGLLRIPQNAGLATLISSLSALQSSQNLLNSNQLTRVLRLSSRISQLLFKVLLFAIFLLNIRAIPGGWHWRLFWPVTKVRIQYLFQRTRSSFALTLAGKTGRKKLDALNLKMEKWLEGITPVGAHPFEFRTLYKTSVTLDESDFNIHMSNSSYPKVLDCARMKAAMELFPQFLRVGGVIPLSSTHFHFVKELPAFARYELRLSIGAWDEKWMYVVGRFVTKSKPSSKTKPSTSLTDATPQALTSPAGTPAATTGPPSLSAVDEARKLDAAVSNRLVTEFGDTDVVNGHVTLHTICVSRVCFKLGRITVPPAVLMATNGISVHPWELADAPPSASEQPKYSPSNPPLTWTLNSQTMILKSLGGSPKRLREFYKGHWRSILDEAKTKVAGEGGDAAAYVPWWDRAMGVGGPVDEMRKRRLDVCRKLVGGMEGVRDMVS
ncbi:hypothetical protein GYMLUDRAFT_232610 [Collybiopsis luxurians FD-317 M1]|uniref:Uncharacterized protein n=1 Tax=Collybiopsis luxurians FD-317 M1 TaxID=944289 RepID=A0A0D0ATS4_9AGAR|nr:hypothetical protein GYMLUDRAFT_232610 [Collybiopsis luxurians FD-317 M1]